MIAYLWVALGSAVGGMARYGVGMSAARLWGDTFPWGTLIINVLGSFVIGFFGTLTLPDGLLPASNTLRTLVMVGFCGGFTTFSSFSLQTLALARDGSWFGAMANVGLSVALCLVAVTAGHLSAGRLAARPIGTATMSRGVLAILDRPETARPVLAAAALVADRLDAARIEALHVRTGALPTFMPTVDVMTEQREQETADGAGRQGADLRRAFDDWRATSGLGEWREATGEVAQVIAAAAAKVDLVVLGRGPGTDRGDAKGAVHAALFDAERAILVVPERLPASLGRHVAVAWKPGQAADRAIMAALPLLLRAERVVILIRTEGGCGTAMPDSLLGKLARAGVPAEVNRFETSGPIGAALLAQAQTTGADLLVMGAYTHSRLAEFVLGGTTSEVLAAADLPVLMHH